MTTAADLLKKAEARRSKKHSSFQPVQRRAWDYFDNQHHEKVQPLREAPKQEQNENENRNNQERNWEQTKNESGNNSDQNREQIENQFRNEITIVQKQIDPIEPNSRQTPISTEDTALRRILTLSGHQKQIMKLITSHIKSRVGAPYTIDILPNVLAVKIGANIEVTRVCLKRLVEKTLLIKLPGERGRNGCSKFKLQDIVVKKCFTLFNDPPSDINIIGNEIGNQYGNNTIYSSNSNINNTTTVLPENWEQIDISLLTSIGFSKTQLLQLFEKQLNTPEMVQESINHFAFALENNPKVKVYNDPLNVLMGVLRKGGGWFEKNYVSPKEKALEELLKFKKQEADRIQMLEKNIIDEEYRIWINNLSEEEKNIITNAVPTNKFIPKGLAEKTSEGYLLQYFKDNIYGK